MGPEQKCVDYKDKMAEEFPCFDFWFTMTDGEILDFEDDNHGVGYIFGLPLSMVWAVIEGVKDEIEGNYRDKLPTDGIVSIKISDIEYFGGQWSDDALAWEIMPAYWYAVEVLSAKSFKDIAAEATPKLF